MTGKNAPKGAMLILDGLGDRPHPELADQTPLEAAATPNLDHLAANGLCGLSDPLSPGLPVGTHTGSAVLLGVPTAEAARLSRGPVEAAGIGIPLLPGDVTLRANFATVEKVKGGFNIIDRRAGRIQEGTRELAALLQNVDLGEGIRASLHAATQHRAVLHLRGAGLSEGITDTDPGDCGRHLGVQKSVPSEPDRGALVTAMAVNHFLRIAHKTLGTAEVNRAREATDRLPANGILTRGAGKLESISSMITHYRLRASLVSGESTVIGLGRLLGYEVHTSPDFTTLANTDIAGKIAVALRSLDQQNLTFIHIKAPDISSHDRNPLEKKAFLERLDSDLEPLVKSGHAICVTGDHSTSSLTGAHCGDPVPTLLYAPGGRRDRCARFGESECLHGGLGRVPAATLLCSLLDSINSITQYRTADAELYGFG